MREEFKRFFSTDSAKAIKAEGYGYINAINYMAPHKAGGVGNLCPHASAGCIALCLGLWSGQAAMISRDTGTNNVRESRERKARYFMHNRAAFMLEAALHIAKQYRYAKRKRRKLVIRMNGSSDIAWEGIRFHCDKALAEELTAITHKKHSAGHVTLLELFHYVQFVDYTKNPRRFDRSLPRNYDLTFSRAEDNEAQAIELLNRRINVAIVFARSLPTTWQGFKVINGDLHDLRHLDPKGGIVVGLTPKGSKAKRDTSGFVVR